MGISGENKDDASFHGAEIQGASGQDTTVQGISFSNRQLYRNKTRNKENFCWQVSYKSTDLLISSDRDIEDKISGPLKDIYCQLESVIEKDPGFLKSLRPVSIKPFFPEEIKKMCLLSAPFNVGPMAAVAGTVNDYLSAELQKYCKNLLVENGGDLYLNSRRDLKVAVYLRNDFFRQDIIIKIRAENMPCGLCSSSGTFGHSYSMGNCDLAAVLSDSPVIADAAATAVANSINEEEDILPSIEHFKKFKGIKGLLIVKGGKAGAWGNIEF